MPIRAGNLLLLLVATAAVVGAPPYVAAAPLPPPKKGKVVGHDSHPRKDDVKYIKCQVCELLAKNAWQQVQGMGQEANASQPLTEMKIIERMEKITDAWRKEGEWIASLDLVEEGDRLVVQEMGEVGNCGVECKTAQLAAEQIMGEHDTDIAEVLFTGKKDLAQFSSWLCLELSEVCRSKPPPLPKGREAGAAFDPRKEGDSSVDAMLGGLADQGLMGGKLKDELLEKLGVREKVFDEEDMSSDALLHRAMAQSEADEAAKRAVQASAEEDFEDWEEL